MTPVRSFHSSQYGEALTGTLLYMEFLMLHLTLTYPGGHFGPPPSPMMPSGPGAKQAPNYDAPSTVLHHRDDLLILISIKHPPQMWTDKLEACSDVFILTAEVVHPVMDW